MGWFSDYLTRKGWTSIQDNAIPVTGTLAKQDAETFGVGFANQQIGGVFSLQTLQELKEIDLDQLMVPCAAYVGLSGMPFERYILHTLPTTGDYIGDELQNFNNFWQLDFSATGISVDREVPTFALLPSDAINGENVYVVDASGDPTVDSGWAIYKSLGDKPAGSWLKIAEQESLDVDLTIFIKKDGSVAFTGNQSMGSNKLTDLANGTNPNDAVNKSQLDTKANDADVIKKNGSVAFTGNQSMGGNALTNVLDPSNPQDAATKAYVDSIAPGFNTTIVEIGDWNMDTTNELTFSPLPVTYANIRAVTVLVRDDGDSIRTMFEGYNADNTAIMAAQGDFRVSTVSIILRRKDGGLYDNATYDATSFNRGWIVITHI